MNKKKTKKESESYGKKVRNVGIIVILLLCFIVSFSLIENLFANNNRVKQNSRILGAKKYSIQYTPEAKSTPPTPIITPMVSSVKTRINKTKLLQQHTVHHSSSANRDNNLKIATKMINNSVVMPGENFSFFGIIGEPNAKKGFKEAGVIVNHKSAKALGGGICEVATSLNTVIVDAGIKTNAQNHSINVGYLNSTDHEATVTYDGGIDLKFTNTLKYPIMIKQSAKGGNVTTKLFKVKEIKRVTLKNPINKQKTRKSYVVKKILAQNTKAQNLFDLNFNKVKCYYLDSNDFFEMSQFKVKKSKRILKSLMKAATEANLEIDRGIGDKKLTVKNTEQFPILVEINYNSKGDVRTEIFKLKEK